MNPIRLLRYLWGRVSGRIAFLDYKIKQRRALRKQKKADPNIYPLS
jgi:hypothetical protein